MTIAPERPVGTTTDVLVPEDVHNRLARYILREHPEFTVEFAGRLVVAAAEFQAASAIFPHVRMAPSKLVDIGWHAWLMHTVDREALLPRIGGVVHHVPDDDGDQDPAAAEIRRNTLRALRSAGFASDEELWPAENGKCSQCHAGCTDSPKS
ncbi:hypothetical protein [Streptomyces bungoensis]|uniref:hypothetical protein n=1 Tax=Streptomyces bungoensis TaxID=285568 RepID=UPI00342CE574